MVIIFYPGNCYIYIGYHLISHKPVMRSIFISVSLICCFCFAHAQTDTIQKQATKRPPLIYLETGVGFGTHTSGFVDINCIFQRNNIISFYYLTSGHTSPTVPADYVPDIFNNKPWQTISMMGLTYGKVFYAHSPLLRYVIKGGLSAGNITTPENFVPATHSGWFNLSSNYTYSNHDQFAAGIIINPEIEFTLSRHFGFTFGAFSNINPVTSVFGFEVSMLFGKVRNNRTDYRQ